MTDETRDALEAERLPGVEAAVRDALVAVGMEAALAIERGEDTEPVFARGQEAVARALGFGLSGPFSDAARAAYGYTADL